MPTKLFLRSTTDNGIGATYLDMITTAGAASATLVVDSVASGTEIQWTVTSGGALRQFITGRVPAGGFTLTTADLSWWCHESAMAVNAGARARYFVRTTVPSEVEIAGGPFDDGIEFGTAATEMTWTGNNTDTALLENERLMLKPYITNAPTLTMAAGTCTLTYNAADAATGDSFMTIAETVTFKAEDAPLGHPVRKRWGGVPQNGYTPVGMWRECGKWLRGFDWVMSRGFDCEHGPKGRANLIIPRGAYGCCFR